MSNSTPVPEEPSLLDYIKAKLRFWDRERSISLPVEFASPVDEAQTTGQALASLETGTDESLSPRIKKVREWRAGKLNLSLPWRSLLALMFALIGQRAWEPSSNPMAAAGLYFYFIALLFLLWASVRKEWYLSALPETVFRTDSLRVRPLLLGMAILFSAIAFLTLGGNMFTGLNLSLWGLAIVFIVLTFWVPAQERKPFWPKIREFFNRERWQLSITRWTLLVLLVTGVAIFFRTYDLNGVPSEPFSDHAEKILDVYDVSQGQTHIFFPRNTGREALQMYLTLAVAWAFQTGLSFLSLKIGTVFCGLLTLPYMYLLGKEYGGRRIGLLAVFFVGIAYWPNVISRVGLRFPLYPLFVAPVLFYLLRGLRTRNRNDLIISGLFLGLGLHGYSPFRVMPLLVVAAISLYLLHPQSRANRKQAVVWLSILALVSFIVFLPLARYMLDDPQMFNYRLMTRISSSETALPGPAWKIFLSNVWNGLRMFNWDDGEIWVNSVTHRPALDVVSGALFLIGAVLVLVRYIRQRQWQDLLLLLAVPILQLPSTLSLAFPGENPALNRAGGALVPAFLLVALAADGLINGIQARMGRRGRVALTVLIGLFLGSLSAAQNYDLVFNKFDYQFTHGAWNTSDMGKVIKDFDGLYGSTDQIWIVPFPYWADTRLPGVWAGIPNRDFAIWPEQFENTLSVPGPKLFILKAEDDANLAILESLYPRSIRGYFDSDIEGHEFYTLFIPADK